LVRVCIKPEQNEISDIISSLLMVVSGNKGYAVTIN
jgi:hypothetical protein